MTDDPHDKTIYTSDWDQHLSKPTVAPRHLEEHEEHWEDPHHWRLTPWTLFWAAVGGAMWAATLYLGYLIYLGM